MSVHASFGAECSADWCPVGQGDPNRVDHSYSQGYFLTLESCRYKVFVGTRVAEIQTLTDMAEWRYVESVNNPADHIT